MTLNDISEKNRGWLLPQATKTNLSPGLYLVATPIGNLRDISLRALDTMSLADVILCEDTRVSGKLLSAYSIKNKKLITYNDHASEETREYIQEMIVSGKSVVLISDAGMPLISDPGYKLAQQCRDAGVYVTSVPGSNAAITALQLSSFPSDAFSFVGFLPAKTKARKDVLNQWKNVSSTLITYEAAPRLLKTLSDIQEVCPERKVAVVREITKIYEESRIDYAACLIAHYEEKGLPKGEIVLLLSPPDKKEWSEDDVVLALRSALQDKPTKKAANQISEQSGWSKKDVYNLALKVKDDE